MYKNFFFIKILCSLVFFSTTNGAAASSALDKNPSLMDRTVSETLFYGEIPGYQIHPVTPHDEKYNHWNDRPTSDLGQVQVVTLHFTHADLDRTLSLFTSPGMEVSAHYVISETATDSEVPGGVLFNIVPEEQRAWHAGRSAWRDITCDTVGEVSRGLNSSSVGIEFVNKGCEGDSPRTWFPFDEAQIDVGGRLVKALASKYKLCPYNIVGHSDIAPGRKIDPGVLFPWGRLYEEFGVGAWLTAKELESGVIVDLAPREPLPRGISEAFFLSEMKRYGYPGIPDGASTITPEFASYLEAFRMHFSANQTPSGLEGPLTDKDMKWVWLLNTKYPRE
jgi:N-acetylmuramoyl-L-alanine amidase